MTKFDTIQAARAKHAPPGRSHRRGCRAAGAAPRIAAWRRRRGAPQGAGAAVIGDAGDARAGGRFADARGRAGQQPALMAQPGADRRAHARHQCRQAARPGQHRALGGVGGMAVARGEVVQSGPGRHGAGVRAVVVAAAIVQIPAQGWRGIALAFQPLPEGDAIQRGPGRIARGQGQRDGEDLASVAAAPRMQGLHLGQEAAVLRQVGLGQALHRQQAVFPAAIAQQSFLRRMDQRGFVVVGRVAAGVALDQAEVGQHLAHVGRFARGQGQVVRARRIVQAVQRAAGGVAGVFRPRHHDEIGMALARQFPGAGQAGDAGTQDRHAAGARVRGLGQRGAVAQRMAGLHAGIADLGRRLDDARAQVAGAAGDGGRGGRAQQERAALHQRMTLRQSSSK